MLISNGFTEKVHTPAIDLSILASVNAAAGKGTDGFPPDMPPGTPSDEPSFDEIPPAEEYPDISNAPPVPENKTADREQRSEPAKPEPETIPEEIPVDIPQVSSDAEETAGVYEDSLPDDVRPDDNKFTDRAGDITAPVASHENVYQSFAGSDQLFQGIPADLNESGFSGGSPDARLSPGNGEPGDGLDSGGYYLKLNYGQIRNLLGNNLVYPKIARRMGWSGEVHVSFLLKMDGTVDEVLIVKSCGFPVLDKSAVKTIEKASPFPNPETDVRIMIPIAYNLD